MNQIKISAKCFCMDKETKILTLTTISFEDYSLNTIILLTQIKKSSLLDRESSSNSVLNLSYTNLGKEEEEFKEMKLFFFSSFGSSNQ